MSVRVLQFSLVLLQDRIRCLPRLTREHCVRIANGVLQVLFGSKESFLLVLSALLVAQEPGCPLWEIIVIAYVKGARRIRLRGQSLVSLSQCQDNQAHIK